MGLGESGSAARRGARLGRCQRLDRERVDFSTDTFAECAVDHLMSRDAPATLEGRGDHPGLEVGLIVRADQNLGAGQAGTDEFSYFFRVHGAV